MHYRNGREAKNGDKIIQLTVGGGLAPSDITAFGILYGAKPGNDYCNGMVAPANNTNMGACLCDCLHVDDVIEMLKEKGLDKRPAGK